MSNPEEYSGAWDNVAVEIADQIATVTINRAEVLNALNSKTRTELDEAMQSVENDPTVKAVIVTGAGNRAFVAGADIRELSERGPLEGKNVSSKGQAVFNRIEAMTKPVAAAVMGFALGGGCELAMACHLRFAHTSARFGQPEINLGLIPGYGGTQRLPRLVGRGPALAMLLSGEMINAHRACELGLANEIIDTWELDENGQPAKDDKGRRIPDRKAFLAAVSEKMSAISKKAPVALRLLLEAVNQGLETDLNTALSVESNLFGLICTTEDFREGTQAFLEKRQARFTGR